jgi:cell division protein ZapA
MSRGKPIPVNLHILDKDYVVACPEEERETLIASAHYLNEKVQQVRDGGKVVSTERIVVVSALNIIHEYLHYKQEKESDMQAINHEIEQLQNKIGVALSSIKH